MNEHLSSQQLSDLVEGLLPPDHVRAVQAHLAACAGCRQALAQRRALVERLRREVPACLAQVTPPPTLRWEHARRRVPFKQRSLVMLRYVRTATASIAVISLLVVLALGLNALLRQASSPAQPDGYEVSAEETVSSSHPKSTFFFTPITLNVQSDLPPIVDELPLYQVEPALPEMSAQEVRLWAERLDMGQVRVYRTSIPNADTELPKNFYVGMNAAWDSLTLYPNGLGFASEYSPQLEGFSGKWSGERVDKAVAQAAGQAFLERLAPYLITVEGTQTQIGFSLTLDERTDHPQIGYRRYDIVPRLDGVPLIAQDGAQNFILVGPEGQVHALSFTPLRVSLAEETSTPGPAEEALQDVLDGKSEYLSRSDWGDWETLSQIESFERPWSQYHREGDKVTVIGTVQWLQGLEGEDDLVLLHNYTSVPYTFILEGDNLDLLAQRPGAQVWGTLVGYQTPWVARLQVERVETASFNPSGAWEGQASWRDGSLWLETASGQELLLPDPPELPDGAQVIVIGTLAYDDPQHLDWTRISTDLEYVQSASSHLLEYDLNVQDAPLTAENPKLHLTLWWHLQDPVLENVNLFVHLLDPKTGELVAQRDVVQSQGQEDTMRRVSQTLDIALGDVPPGDYNLVIGYYDQKTGARLRLTGLVGDSTPDGQLVLPDVIKALPDGEVQVERVASDTPQTVVQKVELAYYAPQFIYTPEPQPALAEPVYLFDIYSPSGGYRLLVYVSAVD